MCVSLTKNICVKRTHFLSVFLESELIVKGFACIKFMRMFTGV